MKKKLKTILKIYLVLAFFLSVFRISYALADYTVLVPLPGISGPMTIQSYLPAAFNLAVGLAALLAFVMLTYGGLEYMTTDAVSGKSAGKEHIQDALWGLVLVIGAYTILYTINPGILNFTLATNYPISPGGLTPITFTPYTSPTGTEGTISTAGQQMTQDQITASNLNAASLTAKSNGEISDPYPPCALGQTTGCVNLNGLTDSTMNGLVTLGNLVCSTNACPNDIVISGGTEAGHSVNSCHNNGTCVDILSDSALDKTISFTTPAPCQQIPIAGGTALWEPTGSTCGGTVASTGNHWHISFP